MLFHLSPSQRHSIICFRLFNARRISSSQSYPFKICLSFCLGCEENQDRRAICSVYITNKKDFCYILNKKNRGNHPPCLINKPSRHLSAG